MSLKYIDQFDCVDKKVIGRFDFNVPLETHNSKIIADTTRIDLALPTIRHILNCGPKKLILMSHLGRPKGQVVESLSLEPIAKYLAAKLEEEVLLTESALDRGITTLLNLKKNKIILLENLRFHPEETKNDMDFAKKISTYGDIYVNDAFGTSHRKHASTYGILANFAKKSRFGGLLLKNELKSLNKIVNSPTKPFIAIIGGAKISDKIKIIERLLTSVDQLLVGGAMAYPFLKAQGFEIGKSLCHEEDISLAKKILTGPSSKKLVLPTDHIVSNDPNDSNLSKTDNLNIPEDKCGLDIGPQTLNQFQTIISNAKTVFWNGPMGLFEKEDFAQGTMNIALAISKLENSFSLVGGGDSVNAVNKSGLTHHFSHISTGGGASLEYIENGSLPCIQALKFGVDSDKSHLQKNP